MLFELFEVALASILKTGSSRSHHDDCENRVGAYRDGKKIVLIKDDHWVHYTKHSFSIKVVEEKRKPLPWPGITGLLGNNDEYLKRFCSKHAISYRVIDLGAQEVARKLHRENSLGMGGSLPTYYELITDDRKVQDSWIKQHPQNAKKPLWKTLHGGFSFAHKPSKPLKSKPFEAKAKGRLFYQNSRPFMVDPFQPCTNTPGRRRRCPL